MTCITKLLELKGDKKFILAPSNEGVIIEDGGTYKGYEYLTVLNGTGFRCGYVAITPEHPLYNFQKDEDAFIYYPDLDVHGGVTFFDKQHLIESDCKDKWIGFDCGHAGDGWDYDIASGRFAGLGDAKTAESIKQVQKIREDVKRKMEYDNPAFAEQLRDYETVRTTEYVVDECKRLIDQLAA